MSIGCAVGYLLAGVCYMTKGMDTERHSGRLTMIVVPEGTGTTIQLTGIPTASEAVWAGTGRPFTFKEETLPENVACQSRGGPERFVSELS